MATWFEHRRDVLVDQALNHLTLTRNPANGTSMALDAIADILEKLDGDDSQPFRQAAKAMRQVEQTCQDTFRVLR